MLPKIRCERWSACSSNSGRSMRRFMILPLLACLLLGLLPAVFAQEEQPGKSADDNGYEQISIFAKALELISLDYLDQNKSIHPDLIYAEVMERLYSLDRHKQHIAPNE